MLTLKATLLNIYTSNEYRNPETKEVIAEAKIKLQLMTNRKMKNGSVKQELLDISVPKDKLPLYENKIGKDVDVQVGIISQKYSFYGI